MEKSFWNKLTRIDRSQYWGKSVSHCRKVLSTTVGALQTFCRQLFSFNSNQSSESATMFVCYFFLDKSMTNVQKRISLQLTFWTDSYSFGQNWTDLDAFGLSKTHFKSGLGSKIAALTLKPSLTYFVGDQDHFWRKIQIWGLIEGNAKSSSPDLWKIAEKLPPEHWTWSWNAKNLQHSFLTLSWIKMFSILWNWMIFLFGHFRYWIWAWCTSRYLFGALGWIGGWSERDLHKDAKQSDADLVKLYW